MPQVSANDNDGAATTQGQPPVADGFVLPDIPEPLTVRLFSIDIVRAFGFDPDARLNATAITLGAATVNGEPAGNAAAVGVSFEPGAGPAGTVIIDPIERQGFDKRVSVTYTLTDPDGLTSSAQLQYSVVGLVDVVSSLTIRAETMDVQHWGVDVPDVAVCAAVLESTEPVGKFVFTDSRAVEDALASVNLDELSIGVRDRFAIEGDEWALALASDGGLADARAQDGSSALANAHETSTAVARAVDESRAFAWASDASTATATGNQAGFADARSFNQSAARAIVNDSAAFATAGGNSTADAFGLQGGFSEADAFTGSIGIAFSAAESSALVISQESSTAMATARFDSEAKATAVRSSEGTALAEGESESEAVASDESGAEATAESSSIATATAESFGGAGSISDAIAVNRANATAGASNDSMATAQAAEGTTAEVEAMDGADLTDTQGPDPDGLVREYAIPEILPPEPADITCPGGPPAAPAVAPRSVFTKGFCSWTHYAWYYFRILPERI